RAYGVPPARCRARGERFSARGLGKTLRLGDGTRAALYRGGQPATRVGRSYRYCAAGGRGRVAAVFNHRGRVALIVSTVPGDRAGSVAVGNRLHAAGASGPYFYGLSSGRVRFVAVASRAELSSRARLGADLRAAGV